MTENPKNCQKCGSPVMPGKKFCESCGAKIEASPVCPQCGAALGPNAKFCESCGMPTGSAAPSGAAKSAAPAAPPGPPGPGTSPAETARPSAESVVKADEPVKTKEKTVPVPVPVKEPKKPEIAKEVQKETSPKKPMSPATMIIAGIIVLALLGAAVFFVVLPMLSGSGTPSPIQSVFPAGTNSGTSAANSATAPAGSVSLTVGPTDVPPNNRALIIDVEKNAISRDIIVTFQGGEGQYGVGELVITLTRSDGTVETKSLTHLERGSTISLKGTDKEDRVQVTANFYNGETYRIVDKVFEYKKRVGSS